MPAGGQVGYGDIVAKSNLGKLAVLAMICVGVVLIPVQTSALYAQLTARRVTLGDSRSYCFLGSYWAEHLKPMS